MDTATMLVASRTLHLVLTDLARTERALSGLAAAHRDTAMPGRTLTQHAVPTTFGLKAAGWRSLVLDARDRVRVVRSALPVQLGGAAGTLAAFTAYGAEDALALPDAYARELGLTAALLPWHTLRTPIADLAGCLAFAAGALGKVAADVLVLCRTEIAEVSEGSGGGSSAMPHKANPVRSTLIAAAARRAPQLAAVLYGSLVAEDERPAGAWHAEWEPLRELLRLVGGAARDAAELAEGLRVHPDVMRQHLDLTHGLIVSERLSAELAPLLGRARAKELLTEVARRKYAEGRPLTELLAGEPELKDLDLSALTDPARYTGSAGALTDRALERR
jgi:3-carboxy-cis,cis-muconate cycloisomerase